MILTEALDELRKPKPFIYSKEIACANPTLLIGLELETEHCHEIGRTVSTAAIEKLGYQIASDNSLRGSAYEFISRPMASKHALASLTDFFALTKFNDGNYSDRCSTHVHVNCQDLTLEQISNVALIYQIVEEILFEFVGHNRDSNLYCIPWNQCRNHHRLVANFLASPRTTLKVWNKYTALNLLPLLMYGTVEFRQMNGTADMTRLTTWINLIGSIFKYATSVELNNLTTTVKELNTTSHYEHFFNTVLGGYLPYNELYRAKLEEGIILAKFGLVSTKPQARLNMDGITIANPPLNHRLLGGVWDDYGLQANPTRAPPPADVLVHNSPRGRIDIAAQRQLVGRRPARSAADTAFLAADTAFLAALAGGTGRVVVRNVPVNTEGV